MNRKQISEQLKEIVKPYIKNEDAFGSFTEDTDFISDLNINSANLVDVVLDIEETFDIVIDNESMEKMINTKNTLDIIALKLEEK